MILVWLLLLLAFPLVAQAQMPSTSIQRAFLVAQFANDLAKTEMVNDSLQQQLALAQKQIDELKAKCGDACKDTPVK